ncbi:MAG: hypothetical protein KIS94_12155 [Chitinophagales bacterium]|nr:hypothetical protein [Chitinophagales bacterium]
MKKVLHRTIVLLCFIGSAKLFAQTENTIPPILSLFDYMQVSIERVKNVAPHFPMEYKKGSYQNQLISWLEKHPAEWTALSTLPEFTKSGIGWTTYGIPAKYVTEPEQVNSSWYGWYKASGVTSEEKGRLFPHFPELDMTLKGDTQGLNFERRVGMWQRLYPKEYIAFLNAPKIRAVNPYITGKVDIQYLPRFIGAEVTEAAPVKLNTGDELADEFDYQLKLRNWLFIFFPEKFDAAYGNDYDFPADFSAASYRKNWKQYMERKKNPEWGTTTQGK